MHWFVWGAQTPLTQRSPCVHEMASLQVVPSLAGGVLHTPVCASQVPARWQASSAVHCTTEVGVPQVPLTQVSPLVHAFWSLQVVPSARVGFVHRPLAGAQTPALWQPSSAVHVFGLPATQVPAAHASARVQASPSLQAVPSAFEGVLHRPVAGWQTPASLHADAAGHDTGLAPTHAPA
jgi:hypothetical protein